MGDIMETEVEAGGSFKDPLILDLSAGPNSTLLALGLVFLIPILLPILLLLSLLLSLPLLLLHVAQPRAGDGSEADKVAEAAAGLSR